MSAYLAVWAVSPFLACLSIVGLFCSLVAVSLGGLVLWCWYRDLGRAELRAQMLTRASDVLAAIESQDLLDQAWVEEQRRELEYLRLVVLSPEQRVH